MSTIAHTAPVRLAHSVDEAYWRALCWFGRRFRSTWTDGMYYVRRSNAWPRQLEEDA